MAVFTFKFRVCRNSYPTGKLFFQADSFFERGIVLPVPIQLSVGVYETEESFHGRQGTLSADGLFFSFRLWSMAWPFLVF